MHLDHSPQAWLWDQERGRGAWEVGRPHPPSRGRGRDPPRFQDGLIPPVPPGLPTMARPGSLDLRLQLQDGRSKREALLALQSPTHVGSSGTPAYCLLTDVQMLTKTEKNIKYPRNKIFLLKTKAGGLGGHTLNCGKNQGGNLTRYQSTDPL